MDTQSLKAFLAVAGQNSFSEAAEHLHLTQSAVSKRIQQLESQLGVALFDRHNRTVSLTDAGLALLPKARDILDLVADTTQQMDNLSGDISGTLSFATSHHIGLHRLPPVLREFIQKYPGVNLNLEFLSSESAYQAVRQRQVDFALTTLGENDDSDLTSIPLWQDTMLCVCSPDHRLANKTELTLNDLAEAPAILPEPDTITYKIAEDAFKQADLTLHAPMPTNFLETIKMMVSVGIGWSLLPEVMVDEHLQVIPWPGKQPERQLGLVHLKNRTLSNATQAIIELMPDNQSGQIQPKQK